MTTPPGLPDRVARLAAWTPLRALTDLAHVVADTWRIAGENHDQLTEIRSVMATSADQIAAINTNLENIRADVQRLNQLATDLQTELANQDPALAERLQPLVDLSQQIADATPEPAPAPEGPATPTA